MPSSAFISATGCQILGILELFPVKGDVPDTFTVKIDAIEADFAQAATVLGMKIQRLFRKIPDRRPDG